MLSTVGGKALYEMRVCYGGFSSFRQRGRRPRPHVGILTFAYKPTDQKYRPRDSGVVFGPSVGP